MIRIIKYFGTFQKVRHDRLNQSYVAYKEKFGIKDRGTIDQKAIEARH